MAEVKLHGFWSSPFVSRVILGLKLKGIPYEYIEEDVLNKSESLLKYNPVHKKIPVLVHGSNPICESMVILEYLDEVWPHQYPLLPTDPVQRAAARFWINFIDKKGLSIYHVLYKPKGEEQDKAVKDSLEMLETIEEHAMKPGQKYFGGEKIGMVDLAFNVIGAWLEVIEQVTGIKLLQPHKFPRLHAWTDHFKQAPVIKDNLPDRDQMLAFFKGRRQMVDDGFSPR